MATKKQLTFEQSITRLDEIAALLDNGDLPLEQSIKLFSEGAALLGNCEAKLAEAKLTVEKLFPDREDNHANS